jgi:hypothetical protein
VNVAAFILRLILLNVYILTADGDEDSGMMTGY